MSEYYLAMTTPCPPPPEQETPLKDMNSSPKFRSRRLLSPTQSAKSLPTYKGKTRVRFPSPWVSRKVQCQSKAVAIRCFLKLMVSL